jgi:hypothetical protein
MSAPDDTLPPGAAASLRDVATASPVSGTDAGLPATLDPDVPNPFWSKGLFVGRHDEVARLERKLREGRSTLLIGGRRVGKTTMIGRLSQDGIGRTLVRADASGWDLSNLETGLGALRGELEGLLPTTYGQASRDEIVHLLDAASPLALVIDEADYLLLAPWGPLFYRFLRWLDDNHMRESISLLLVGGPVLELFRDPDDKGSPPLNTADPDHVWPLGRDAVMELASLAGRAGDCDEILAQCGGHAWLTTTLLAEIWEGKSLEDASDALFDTTAHMYEVWERQLGEQGRALLRRLPSGGVPWSDFTRSPWVSYRAARKIGMCVGAIRRDGNRVCRGPRIFTDWLTGRAADETIWDVAISYASENELLARQIHAQLRGQFKVFFAPDESAGLWGTNLSRVLPNTYGVQSRYVLVLSTPEYVSKYWTRIEYESAAAHVPERILLLDLGALPDNLPKGLVYRGGSSAEMVGLIDALRSKLSSR